jgi:hypothetical protein
LKLLAEAEEEELLDDDDDVAELRKRDVVDPVVLALDPVGLETEPELENSRQVQGQALGNTHEDNADDVDAELVVVTVAPMEIGALVPIT